jgi:hypothetical protein
MEPHLVRQESFAASKELAANTKPGPEPATTPDEPPSAIDHKVSLPY